METFIILRETGEEERGRKNIKVKLESKIHHNSGSILQCCFFDFCGQKKRISAKHDVNHKRKQAQKDKKQ